MISFKYSTAMETQKKHFSAYLILLIALVTFVFGCKKGYTDDAWVETRDVSIVADKSSPENGKQYLEVIYENIGSVSFRKIKYELIMRTGAKIDTVIKTIIPELVFKPKDKHLVPRAIGELPATFDDVRIGKVWVIEDTK
jgi:hypothetical protein